MVCGLLKSVSQVAVLAALGTGLSFTAQAADLGGNCCADLEERVAELEATTARKGNRKVSLQVYGRVSEAVIWWNDGKESNTYVQENYNIKNVLGFQGAAKINSDWSAGYRLEVGIRAYRSSNSSQVALGSTNGLTITSYNTQSVALRHANWFIESQTYGRMTVGRTDDAMRNISSINLAEVDGFGQSGHAYGYINNGMFYRVKGVARNVGLSGFTWGDISHFRNGDGPATVDYSQTGSQVKYTSPFFLGQSKSSGFRTEASWGQDDFWSVALRYVEEIGAFRVAAGVGYGSWRDLDRGMCSNASNINNTGTANGGVATTVAPGAAGGVTNVSCNGLQVGGSAMHTPTGLYVSGGYARIHDDQRAVSTGLVSTGLPAGAARSGVNNEDTIWWAQGGWEAKLNALGKTTFWGMYTEFNTGQGVRNNAVQTVAATDVINSFGATALIAGAKTEVWGLGVSQSIDAAAMNIHAGYFNASTDITLKNTSATAAIQTRKSNALEDYSVYYTGATIRF